MLIFFNKSLFLIMIMLFSNALFAESVVNITEDKTKMKELKLERVELYPSFAYVYFSIDFSNKTTFTIPSTFYAESFIVDYSRSKGLMSAEISTTNIDTVTPKYLQADFDKIKKITDELIQLKAELSAYESASNITDKTNFNITDLKMLDALTKTVIKNKIEYVKKSEIIREDIIRLESTLKRLQSEFQSKLPPNYNKALSITLTGGSNTNAYFKLQTNLVSWSNRYSFDLNSTTGEINVKHFINLSQMSGYDWSNDIVIHTKNSSTDNHYNRLTPEIVDFESAVASGYRSRAVKDMSEMKYQSEVLEEEDNGELALPVFEVSSNIAEVVYNIKANIKSEPKSTLIPLDSFSMNSSPEFILTPLYNSYSMIVAKVNEVPKYIFNGETVLSIDNIFMGQSSVGNHYIGAELLLSFGYSNLITAERKDIITKDNGGIWKSNSERGYDITIKNNSDIRKEIKVTDRIPYSTNDGIKVKDIKITPAYLSESSGVIDWKLILNKGESKQITVRYKLDYPKDKKITVR